MADESLANKPQAMPPKQQAAIESDEHYEVVSEYRIGEGAPPLFLVIAFIFIVVWDPFLGSRFLAINK